MLKYRKYVTTSVGFTFAVVGVTGIIFKFFFKNLPLENIHGWLGTAMVVAAIIHIVQNWSSLKGYLRQGRVLSLLIPIALTIVFFALAPSEERGSKGGPRALTRTLSHGKISALASALDEDINQIAGSMKEDGLQIESLDETVEALARENKKKPDAILNYFIQDSKD